MQPEWVEAVEYLRNRFRREAVEHTGGATEYARSLLQYLRTREEPKLLFSPGRLRELAALAAARDQEEHAWCKEIADNAVEGRLYGASNAYCRRFLAVDRETFDFSSYEHHDPQAIRGLNRHRWFECLAREYWHTGERSYFDALMREWDFFIEKVPFPDEAFLRTVQPSYASTWQTDGADWEPASVVAEKERVSCFPQGGVAAMRSSSGPHAGLLLFDNGPNAAGHAHKNNLTIHYDALGVPVIVDPGRWIYRQDTDRWWIAQPESHNTIVAEPALLQPGEVRDATGIRSIARPDDPRMVTPIAMDHGAYASACSSLSAYTAAPGARVERRLAVSLADDDPWLLVVDRVEAGAGVLWTNSWLLPASGPAREADGCYVARPDAGPLVTFAAHATSELALRDDTMFWCPNYGEKLPARWIRFSAPEREAVRAFAFVPRSEAPADVRLQVSETWASLAIGGSVRVELPLV